jgi:hypothetical protein
MARTFREMKFDGHELTVDIMLGPAFSSAVYHWAISMTGSVADTERKHARNRAFALDKNMSFPQFVADFCNKEFKGNFNARKAKDDSKPKPPTYPDMDADAAPSRPSIVKARSAFEVANKSICPSMAWANSCLEQPFQK